MRPSLQNVNQVVFNSLAVRNTSPAVGSTVNVMGASRVLFINNTLNQAGNYQVEYSVDGGTTWVSVGSAQALAANSGPSFVAAIGASAVSPCCGMYRITYTASVSPASGSLYMSLQTYYGA